MPVLSSKAAYPGMAKATRNEIEVEITTVETQRVIDLQLTEVEAKALRKLFAYSEPSAMREAGVDAIWSALCDVVSYEPGRPAYCVKKDGK